MMTKKDFIKLADMMREMDREYSEDMFGGRVMEGSDAIKYIRFERVKKMLADFCASQNYRFNRERWMDYIDGLCGPRGGRIK